MSKIETIDDLRQAIVICRRVLVRPCFGSVELWVKISKTEARWYLREYGPQDTAASLGMDRLGFWDSEKLGFLYIGG